jgi:hypothetical protein
VTEEIREDIKKFLESNENADTIYQCLWDITKAVLRGKFIAVIAYIKKKKLQASPINNLMLYLNLLGKEE